MKQNALIVEDLATKRLSKVSPTVAFVVKARLVKSMLAPCLTSALFCAVLLGLVLRLDRANLSLPINYLGDAIVFLSRAKALIQGDWIHYNSRIGMPFGADLWDFPMNITLDSAGMLLTSVFTDNPAILVNVQWLGAMILSAAIATYCLLRLSFTPQIAVSIGVIYALQPYGFFRGISHLHSVYYLVPLVATAATELALGRFSAPLDRSSSLIKQFRGIVGGVPAYVWIGCIGIGLSYLYSAFFGCFTILSAALLAFLGTRQTRPLIIGALLVGVLVTAVAIDLSPTLLHWATDGKNPAMDFKHPAEAEIYGLKIRFLLTPNPEHPFESFRDIDKRLKEAKFPFDTENESTRLGTLGSLGFLFILGYAGSSLISPRADRSDSHRLLGTSAALLLACMLLATVGGFGDFFNTFVTADIRAYNRIGPFISFFCMIGLSVFLTKVQTWWASKKYAPVVFTVMLASAATGAALDQAVTSGYLPHEAREHTFLDDRKFVMTVESQMPADAPIFQLPHAEFPVEHVHHRMLSMCIIACLTTIRAAPIFTRPKYVGVRVLFLELLQPNGTGKLRPFHCRTCFTGSATVVTRVCGLTFTAMT
jgi:hypothetical protein